jgi:hypothetical protein
MKYYHATYEKHLPSIIRHGLDVSKRTRKSWSFSEKVIYLSTLGEVAHSYADCSDDVPEKWLYEIIVFEIDEQHLDLSKLKIDRNVHQEQDCDAVINCFEYHGVIPPNVLKMVNV